VLKLFVDQHVGRAHRRELDEHVRSVKVIEGEREILASPAKEFSQLEVPLVSAPVATGRDARDLAQDRRQ
jgi:hypothetical protein